MQCPSLSIPILLLDCIKMCNFNAPIPAPVLSWRLPVSVPEILVLQKCKFDSKTPQVAMFVQVSLKHKSKALLKWQIAFPHMTSTKVSLEDYAVLARQLPKVLSSHCVPWWVPDRLKANDVKNTLKYCLNLHMSIKRCKVDGAVSKEHTDIAFQVVSNINL